MSTLSSEPRELTEAEVQALEDFAALNLPLERLRLKLREVLRVEFADREVRVDCHFLGPEPLILITKQHLERALDQKRQEKITEVDLSTWASMLLLIDAYVFDEKDQDLIADW